MRPIVDFFVALATSVKNWRVGRGMDAETGAPLQAQSVLEAFLQRQREEAKAQAEINRRAWEQSKQDGAALAEALERSPHQIVLDDDGTPLKFHINKETRDNWDATITWLTNGKPKSADEMRRLVTVFFGAPDVLRFIENETHVFGEVTGWNLNENIPFMIEAGTLLKIYEGTASIGRSMGYAHGHNLSRETMYRLIDAIDSPVAVILERDRDGYPTGALIFLTELTEKTVSEDGTPVDSPVYIPIRITPQTAGHKIFYRISSAYGLSDARKWNGLFARIRRNPKDILFANRGKIEKYRTPFGERYKNPNGYRSGRVQNQSTKAQPLDLRRMADELTVGLSGTRWVPDEKGLAKFAPNSSLPSAPSIIDQTETETQEENNETYHINVWSGAPQEFSVPSMAFVGSGTGGNNEGRGLYSSGVRGVAQDKYARYAVSDFEDRIVVSYDGDVLAAKDDDDLFSVPLMFADEVKREAIEALQAENDIDVQEIAKRAKEAVAANLERLAKNAQQKLELANTWGPNVLGPRQVAQRAIEQASAKLQELEELDVEKVELELPPLPAVMEQTWFTNRPEGDVSHLLNWLEPVTPEQMDWVVEAAEKAGFSEKEIAFLWGRHKKGESTPASRGVYMRLETIFHSRENNKELESYTSEDVFDIHENEVFKYGRQASEFLLTADIDGVRYPVNYRNGSKGEEGWNYVAFSDEHLRVDHVYEYNPETDDFERKWHDPTAAQYRATERAQLEKSLENALGQTGGSRKGKIKVVRFFIGLPPILAQCGLSGAGIEALPSKLKYIRDHHHLDAAALAELPARLENPVAVFQTNGGRLAVLTDLLADDGTGRMAPVMAVLENGDAKRNARLVTAYSRTANSEGYYQEAFRDKDALRFIDTKRVALLPFERTSMIEEVNEGDNNNTIAQSGGDVKPGEQWHDPGKLHNVMRRGGRGAVRPLVRPPGGAPEGQKRSAPLLR